MRQIKVTINDTVITPNTISIFKNVKLYQIYEYYKKYDNIKISKNCEYIIASTNLKFKNHKFKKWVVNEQYIGDLLLCNLNESNLTIIISETDKKINSQLKILKQLNNAFIYYCSKNNKIILHNLNYRELNNEYFITV